MRFVIVLAALALVSSAGGATRPSGLRGLVTRGPVVPACRAGDPCGAPAANVTLAFTRNGAVVRRTTTDARGRYRVALRPGAYGVRLEAHGRPGPELTPDHARVTLHRVARVDFSYDTGIR
jgi:hypothetical protein